MVRYTLNRTGQFTVNTYGKNHCGTKPVLAVKYALKVTCKEGSLDGRGFLFDQVRVDQFFQSLKFTDKSCEEFSVQCSRKLFGQIMSENTKCKVSSMELTLSPEPYAASITFEYQEDEAAYKKAA